MTKLSGNFTREYREKLRESMWQAQDGRCAICGEDMLPADIEDLLLGWSLDHVWPLGRYPYRHIGNLVLAHVECNNEKADRDPVAGELLMLELVNAALGFRLTEKPMRRYCDTIEAPSALAIALSRALAA